MSDAVQQMMDHAVSQQSIIYVDATPNDDYPLRILRAYRENCNVRIVSDPPNPMYEFMNQCQISRAAILDKAIQILEQSEAILDTMVGRHFIERIDSNSSIPPILKEGKK